MVISTSAVGMRRMCWHTLGHKGNHHIILHIVSSDRHQFLGGWVHLRFTMSTMLSFLSARQYV